jgi:hypothetical protein
VIGYYVRRYCWNHRSEYVRMRDDLELAIRLAPGWSDPCNALAWPLATCPDPSIRDFAEAIDLELEAISPMDDFDRQLSYQQRLALYEGGVAYQEEPDD